jgi:low temperature requirement protein LtrA
VTAIALTTSTDPGRFGRAYSYIHVVMVAGIIVTAVGDELVIAHSAGATELAWLAVILGGPALFVAGHALLKRALFGHAPWSHAIALVALAVLAPALLLAPPLVIAASATVVLLGVAAADTLVGRAYPRASSARSR